MTHRTVSDIMSTEVISVRTTTGFHDLAALLATDRIGEDVFGRQMWIGPTEIATAVDHGIVTLHGTLEQKSLVGIAADLVRGVDGVVGIANHLTYHVDDTKAVQHQY